MEVMYCVYPKESHSEFAYRIFNFFVCKLREKSDIKRVSTPPEPLSFILFIFTKKLYVYKQRPEMNILKA